MPFPKILLRFPEDMQVLSEEVINIRQKQKLTFVRDI